jgi:hypothetical protein
MHAGPVNGAPTNGVPVNGAPRVLAGESIAKLANAPAPVAAPPLRDAPPPTAMPAQPGPDRRPGPNQGPNQGPPMGDRGTTCTAPQLRRFIKSRPYVPMHELRRRFGIDGQDDDVTGVSLSDGRIYVGLPEREGALLGELLKGGEIGFELSLDPRTPIVIGVYPMRPVPRS